MLKQKSNLFLKLRVVIMKLKIQKLILFLVLLTASRAHSSELIRVCAGVSPPYVNGNMDTGEMKDGIDVDVFKFILDKLGIKYKMEIIPWAKCEFSLESGIIDISLKVSKTPEREKFLSFPKNEVWESIFVFFTNTETKKNYKVENYENVKKNNLKIGVTRRNSYNPDFWKAFPSINKTEQKFHPQIEVAYNQESNLQKLSNNKIQLYPQDKLVGIYSANKLGLSNITYYNFILFKKFYYHAFAKNSKYSSDKYKNINEVMNAYDLELKMMKLTKMYDSIFKKYVNDKVIK